MEHQKNNEYQALIKKVREIPDQSGNSWRESPEDDKYFDPCGIS